jgi:hypothetical protein
MLEEFYFVSYLFNIEDSGFKFDLNCMQKMDKPDSPDI